MIIVVKRIFFQLHVKMELVRAHTVNLKLQRLLQKETFAIKIGISENFLLAWNVLEWNDTEVMWDYEDFAFIKVTFYII